MSIELNAEELNQYLKDLELDQSQLKDLSEVKNSFKKLAKQHHPDHGGDSDTFRKIYHAYKMLTDRSYVLKAVKEKQGGQRNLDALFNIVIDFDQAFFGDQVTLTFNPFHIDDAGNPQKIDRSKDVRMDVEVVRVRIPEGTQNGHQIKIAGKGLRQRERKGNLVLNLQIQPHVRFKMQQSDIHSQEEIPLDVMLAGGDVEVLTMYGLRTLRIPAGSAPGSTLKIRNCGVAKVGAQIVTIRPKFPTKDSLKSNSIWKKLGIKWEDESSKDEEDRKVEEEYEEVFNRSSGNKGIFHFFS